MFPAVCHLLTVDSFPKKAQVRGAHDCLSEVLESVFALLLVLLPNMGQRTPRLRTPPGSPPGGPLRRLYHSYARTAACRA